jgi:hypothetical protein
MASAQRRPRSRGVHAALAPFILSLTMTWRRRRVGSNQHARFLDSRPGHVGVEGPTVSLRFDAQ